MIVNMQSRFKGAEVQIWRCMIGGAEQVLAEQEQMQRRCRYRAGPEVQRCR
jgi:hypothetical protein